jgi:L-lactate dehydrogenase
VLDTTRFRSLLAERLEVSPDSVIAYMLGEHGDSMVPLLSSASVAGIPLDQFPGYSPQMVQEVVEATRYGGAEVIKRKGGTFYSVAPSICAVLRAVRWDLKQVLPVTSLVDGPLGLRNMCLSLPCIVGKRGRERVLVPPMTDQEQEALRHSHRVLREAADSVGLP